jgi:hypothetical protein
MIVEISGGGGRTLRFAVEEVHPLLGDVHALLVEYRGAEHDLALARQRGGDAEAAEHRRRAAAGGLQDRQSDWVKRYALAFAELVELEARARAGDGPLDESRALPLLWVLANLNPAPYHEVLQVHEEALLMGPVVVRRHL